MIGYVYLYQTFPLINKLKLHNYVTFRCQARYIWEIVSILLKAHLTGFIHVSLNVPYYFNIYLKLPEI